MVFFVAAIAIWHRNRDIVRDLYDPATMIAAAGKIHAGLRPYTDVRSPMQTAVYYLGWATECIFGRSYLGLSWGGLVQALGGGLLVGWIVARRWSVWPAVIVAGAVTLGGLSQHTMFFYNPVGLLCLALVTVGLGRRPALDRLGTAEAWLVLAALFVGGTNKLNFQALTMGLGGLLLLRAWVAEEIAGASFRRQAALLVAAGVIAPLGFELAWTGATLRQWIDQVVLGPTARWEYVRHFSGLHNFTQPPYAFHHHILFGAIGGFGFLLLLTVGVAGAWAGSAAPRRGLERVLRAGLVAMAIAGSSLLLVTNHETVNLTSAAFYVCAVALTLAFAPAREPGALARGALLAGGAVWIVCGSYAAWHGSRVLYGPNPPPRSAYERLVHAPKLLAYFEGVRFERDHLPSLLALADKMRSMEDADGQLHGILFGPATEWAERAYPECIVRGMPIWYHGGTSLGESDAAWFAGTLQQAGVRRMVAHPNWELWPSSIGAWIAENFRGERMADRYLVYHLRPRSNGRPAPDLARPAGLDDRAFRDETASNVLISATAVDPASHLVPTSAGAIWGARGNSAWDWPFPVCRVEGVAVATIPAFVSETPRAVFRILANDGHADELLWEQSVRLGPRRRAVHMPFQVRPDGRTLRLEIQTSANVTAGWSHLAIRQSGASAAPIGLPFLHGLARPASSSPRVDADRLLFTSGGATDSKGFAPIPLEAWRRLSGPDTRIHVAVDLTHSATEREAMVVVAVVWSRAGRIEILRETLVDTSRTRSFSFDGAAPEPDGWLGVQIRPDRGAGPEQRGRVTASSSAPAASPAGEDS